MPCWVLRGCFLLAVSEPQKISWLPTWTWSLLPDVNFRKLDVYSVPVRLWALARWAVRNIPCTRFGPLGYSLKMDLNDRALILRAQQRDVAAFSALVERWWVYLVRFARSVVGEADAEDVVQDGLLTVWDKLPALRVPEAFPAWTVRIISRACFRRARRQRKMVPLTAAVWEPRLRWNRAAGTGYLGYSLHHSRRVSIQGSAGRRRAAPGAGLGYSRGLRKQRREGVGSRKKCLV